VIRSIARVLDSFRGSGDHAITVPPMDGALQPNEALERASLFSQISAPDALLLRGDRVLVSSGRQLIEIASTVGTTPRLVTEFEAEVFCAALSTTGTLAVGLADGRIVFREFDAAGAPFGSPRPDMSVLGSALLKCPTALAWTADNSLVVCQGSRDNGPLDWKRDLTQRGSSGSVWRVDAIGGAARCLVDGLAFPNGLLLEKEGTMVVSESWKSRLVRIAHDGRVTSILSDLPGYPAGLAEREGGGAWLALFAPRSQLFEFILRERELRERMMQEIDPDHWQAPSLRPPRSFLEPLQGGALKQLGIMKPWAPSRSYGLVLALGADFQPEGSAHSRANGSRHGSRNIVEHAGTLLAASKGGDAIVALALNPQGGFA